MDLDYYIHHGNNQKTSWYLKVLMSIYRENDNFPNKISCGFNDSTSLHLMGCPWPHKHLNLFQTLFFYCPCNVNIPTCQTPISKLPCCVKYRLWNRTDAREHIHYIKMSSYAHIYYYVIVRYAVSAAETRLSVCLCSLSGDSLRVSLASPHKHTVCFARWENKVLWVWNIISGVMKTKVLPWSGFYGHVLSIF